MDNELIRLEEQGWRALSAGADAAREFYGKLLASDAVMLFPGGLMLVGRERILESMGGEPWSWHRIHEPRVVWMGPDAGVATYRAEAARGEGEPYIALFSSAYARRKGEWKLVLHQQTPK